jgi:hypothetical protein
MDVYNNGSDPTSNMGIQHTITLTPENNNDLDFSEEESFGPNKIRTPKI